MENVKAFVAIDFEYLYLAQYDTPCAVGLVKVINNVVIEKYYSLIHQPAQEATLAPNNGITPEMLVDAPHYDKVYTRMVEFIGDLPLVAHNASVERKVLSETPCPDHLPFLADGAFIDTDYLSGHRSLQALCEEYNIPLNHHNALSDAEACAEVYLRLCGTPTAAAYDPVILPVAIPVGHGDQLQNHKVVILLDECTERLSFHTRPELQ